MLVVESEITNDNKIVPLLGDLLLPPPHVAASASLSTCYVLDTQIQLFVDRFFLSCSPAARCD
jgi:hypothetical protein